MVISFSSYNKTAGKSGRPKTVGGEADKFSVEVSGGSCPSTTPFDLENGSYTLEYTRTTKKNFDQVVT